MGRNYHREYPGVKQTEEAAVLDRIPANLQRLRRHAQEGDRNVLPR